MEGSNAKNSGTIQIWIICTWTKAMQIIRALKKNVQIFILLIREKKRVFIPYLLCPERELVPKGQF